MLARGKPRLIRRAMTLAAAAAVTAGALSAGWARPAAAAPADDVRSGEQWALNMLDIPAAWDTSKGAGVTVAVIDSGVKGSVTDLAGSVTQGPDLTGLKTSPSNSGWGEHGTWMASIIAGHGHDDGNDGVVGVAPDARVLSIRVIPDKDDPGFKQYDDEPESRIQQSLATGIRDAVSGGAQVISMSIGYSASSSVVRSAVQYAEAHGVVLVASSGNSGQDLPAGSDGFAPVSFPAEYPGVLSVAAVNADGAVASFSSDNLSVQVAAPGVDVLAQGRDGGYWEVSGTSPACAMVAGVAAIIKARYPKLAPALVDEALTSTAHGTQGTAGTPSYNAKSGFGTVDAAKALKEAGLLAAQRPGTSPQVATAHFGGGAAGVPASPVAPRGRGQLDRSLLGGVVALVVFITGVVLLAVRRRRRDAVVQQLPPRLATPGPEPAWWEEEPSWWQDPPPRPDGPGLQQW